MRNDTPWTSLKIPQAAKNIPYVDLDWRDTYKLIEAQGVFLEHYTALPCFCGGENPLCPACGGAGFTYNTHQRVQGILTSISSQSLLWQQYGELVTGMANLTLKPHYLPGFRDKYIPEVGALLEKEIAEREIEQPAETKLSYPIASRSLISGDFYHTSQNLPFGVLTLISKSGKANEVGIDFDVSDSGTIIWKDTGNNPSIGEDFVVAYFRRPVFIVFGWPHNIRTAWRRQKMPPDQWFVQELPVELTLRLESLPWEEI